MSDPHPPRTLGAILYPDFELLDYYGPLEMFGSTGHGLKIVTVSEQAGPVSSVQGPCTVADYSFATAPSLDLILLPGGIGTMEQLGNGAMLDFLRQRSAPAEVVMSVCSGSAILARAGLLDGRSATSNKMFFSLATDQSDKVQWVQQARWVEDGKFVTSSGVSAGTGRRSGDFPTDAARATFTRLDMAWKATLRSSPRAWPTRPGFLVLRPAWRACVSR